MEQAAVLAEAKQPSDPRESVGCIPTKAEQSSDPGIAETLKAYTPAGTSFRGHPSIPTDAFEACQFLGVSNFGIAASKHSKISDTTRLTATCKPQKPFQVPTALEQGPRTFR
mmetsp:Transcript_35772/g.87992  ORF Transcript_35772/g.87992 Transcript_35772/m.87992 type:complete len:112 (+) Transcript_35772:597-932(+)